MADAKDESFSTSEEDVEALKKKGYCWTRDETLLLISLYQQNQELFKNVNYKKKQVWELIASLTLVRGGFRGGPRGPRPPLSVRRRFIFLSKYTIIL